MTWFFVALLVAIGGIWSAYTRSKGMKAADAEARAKAHKMAQEMLAEMPLNELRQPRGLSQ